MAVPSSKKINVKSINLYLFDSFLYRIIILVIKINFQKFKKRNDLSYCDFRVRYSFEIKNESKITIIVNKTKNKKNDNNIIFRNYFIIILITFLLLNKICQIKSNFLLNLFHFQDSKITLKIKGIGDSIIFGNESSGSFKGINYLKEIYINGNKQDKIEYKYYFNQTNNFVDLIWFDYIKDCGFMFWKCTNIIEINLSNFDTSHVTAMNAMFSYCSSLTSIDLTNLKTSLVKYMNWMFAYCSSLTSLNLSNFNTTQVIDMNDMFISCSSLTSLNLSNFITSKVTNTHHMFKDCTNLEYINLINFDEIKLSDTPTFYNTMFSNISDNVVICINEIYTQSKILPLIKNITCNTLDCINDWKSKQKKIINNNNQCIESCDKSSQYIYEYNGKCYDNCEQGYLYDDNNNKMNECKCELDQCLKC